MTHSYPTPLPPTEATTYAARLREVETLLLCQAFGGQVPQPDGQQRCQRYLNGEISYREAFGPLLGGAVA